MALRKEEDYSNEVALQGFTQQEKQITLKLLQRIRENLEGDWQLVKKGGKRKYLEELANKPIDTDKNYNT